MVYNKTIRTSNAHRRRHCQDSTSGVSVSVPPLLKLTVIMQSQTIVRILRQSRRNAHIRKWKQVSLLHRVGVVSSGHAQHRFWSDGNESEVSKAHSAAGKRVNRSEETTIFEKIASKEIPASIVHEDEQVLI